MNKKIAFIIHNMVLYHTIKNLYFELIKQDFEVSIFIADNTEQADWLEMADNTYNHLTGQDINLFKSTEYNGEEFDIAFYPYLPYQFEIKSKINIRYQYGMAKPVWNFKAETLLFDYCLCYGNYDFSFLQHYCQTDIVGNLKYAHLPVSVIEEKKLNHIESHPVTVLYLPTYGKESSFDLIINDLLSLPENCQIKIKLHHGTEFLEPERKEQIRQLPNVQIYGQNDLLEELLLDSDVVISDGSSACFDAIYFCKPLVLAGEYFGDDFYGEEPITKQLFTKYGIVRYNSNKCTLIELVSNTLVDKVYLNKIYELREYFFPVRGRQTLDMVIDVINNLMKKNTVEYQSIRKAIQSYIKNSIESNNRLSHEINDAKFLIYNQKLELESVQNKLNGVQNELSGIYNSRSWKFVHRLRSLKRLFVKSYK